MPDSTPPIGRVASPRGLEATSEGFAFWVAPDAVVERTQIVKTECELGGETVAFYGTVDEVRRRSRTSGVHEDFDADDGDPTAPPPYAPEGVTYAEVSVLRAVPNRLTPPLEQSPVVLGGEVEAARAYGFDDPNKRWLSIGRLRNGGAHYAGSALVDLDYLLGENGGHLNVTGITGVGTKSSFLLVVLKALLHYARATRDGNRDKRLDVIPVVFNVKGKDLLWINEWHQTYLDREGEHATVWGSIDPDPEPFADVAYHTPAPVDGLESITFSWSFRDALKARLLPYLVADDDLNERQRAVILDLQAYFTDDGEPLLKPPPGWDGGIWPDTWRSFLAWLQTWSNNDQSTVLPRAHHKATKGAAFRRLRSMLREGEAIFAMDDISGSPLALTSAETTGPHVVHIGELPRALQRFVVAAVNKQLVEDRLRAGAPGSLRYVVVLDELNRFAPRGASDPVTRLLEEISTERRSQGIILFGAQQFASEVSAKVVESASIRALGRTGQAELSDRVWKGWPAVARQQAAGLGPAEKLVSTPTLRGPMLFEVPYPAWAMRHGDIGSPNDLSDFSDA